MIACRTAAGEAIAVKEVLGGVSTGPGMVGHYTKDGDSHREGERALYRNSVMICKYQDVSMRGDMAKEAIRGAVGQSGKGASSILVRTFTSAV